jgi:hypothetical protein
MASVEILRAHKLSLSAEPMLSALAAAAREAGDQVKETGRFAGGSDWLVLFGVGAAVNDSARRAQLARGGRVLMWDLGYVDRKKAVGHLRMSIDRDHPQDWLEKTEALPMRWARLGVPLREEADAAGPVLLIGLGRKSRAYLHLPFWERDVLSGLQKRFPGRQIIFRPKGKDRTHLPCMTDRETQIDELMRGASLVVCRHSNCAVDATIAGVPFEAQDGAAMWLQHREFTPANRLAFLQRLAWWQWRADEAAQAWAFAKQVTST